MQMHAELQVLSPLVPIREVLFLRFCKQHAEGLWAVVDVSVDSVLRPDGSHQNGGGGAAGYMGCRLLPSGCIVQDMNNGYSKVRTRPSVVVTTTPSSPQTRPYAAMAALGNGSPDLKAGLNSVRTACGGHSARAFRARTAQRSILCSSACAWAPYVNPRLLPWRGARCAQQVNARARAPRRACE